VMVVVIVKIWLCETVHLQMMKQIRYVSSVISRFRSHCHRHLRGDGQRKMLRCDESWYVVTRNESSAPTVVKGVNKG